MEKIYLDVGSSTIKAYLKEGDKISLCKSLSVHFKSKSGSLYILREKQKGELIKFITSLQKEYPHVKIKSFATAFFRNLKNKQKVIDEVFTKTGVKINILPEELEAFYIEQALLKEISSEMLKEGILIVNIGGGSTELIFKNKSRTIRKVLNFGVGSLLSEYPDINKSKFQYKFDKMVEIIKKKLPDVKLKVENAFYTGGELTYMKLTEYPLKNNKLFKDAYHKKLIERSAFIDKSQEIFNNVKLKKLMNLEKKNPNWMKGAKPCTLIAASIFQKYEVKTIIPSDTNLMHGVDNQEYRTITISGSFRKHLDYIMSYKEQFENFDARVLSPRFKKPKNPGSEFVVFEGEEDKSPLDLERFHLESIKKSDVLFVCNPDGYVGASTMMEIGYALALGTRIIFAEKPEEFMLNVIPAEIYSQ